MTKGKIKEIISKAKFGDGMSDYKVLYRDFERLVEVNLDEFLKISDNFEAIPMSRIQSIKKKNKILFQKTTR
ncbi:MAG TPA: DUF504 domain-containing protein [Nitrosopumilaceae archaeon]|nr:DUF504 domain-containing protein [Nitrosopumilaceae archaeon]